MKKLLITQEKNASGLYVINLCINGTWQEVIVDDYFPVLPGSNVLAFG